MAFAGHQDPPGPQLRFALRSLGLHEKQVANWFPDFKRLTSMNLVNCLTASSWNSDKGQKTSCRNFRPRLGFRSGLATCWDTRQQWPLPPLQIGIDMEDVAETLEKAGLESFGKSFDSLMDSLKKKSDQLTPA
jgi:hypothetical protein